MWERVILTEPWRGINIAAVSRSKLAIINGFLKLDESAPHGTNHAAFAICEAFTRCGAYSALDVFVDSVASFNRPGGPRFVAPKTVLSLR